MSSSYTISRKILGQPLDQRVTSSRKRAASQALAPRPVPEWSALTQLRNIVHFGDEGNDSSDNAVSGIVQGNKTSG